jgi:hypothetical protein
MYSDLINKDVIVIVSTKGEQVMEYKGKLIKDYNDSIRLENVKVNMMITSMQNSLFGSGITSYFDGEIKTATINKIYIISVQEKK